MYKREQTNNTLTTSSESWVFFIDMNSFFATAEQQHNYWLRNRPVGVCVYTGKHGFIIAPSIEAKKRGIRLGMRLSEGMKICPELIPVETKPERYREAHIKFIKVLEKYSDDVIPKSIDEAVADLSKYKINYKNQIDVAKRIKEDIKKEVGDWFKVSIGIAPNAFLAKFASNLQKPDGLVLITPENIDEVLGKAKLTDLPGIKDATASKLISAGIRTPLELRYSEPGKIKHACNSIIGVYWHYRLNFAEVDQSDRAYKTMQAMRQISREQRESIDKLHQLFMTLCTNLEKRMVNEGVFCNEISFASRYEDGYEWKEHIITSKPIQDGIEMMEMIKIKMQKFQDVNHCEDIINSNMTSMSITVSRLIPEDAVEYEMFSKDVVKNNLRKVVYSIKDKFGTDKIMRAIELKDESILKDVIGFGSVKDLHQSQR